MTKLSDQTIDDVAEPLLSSAANSAAMIVTRHLTQPAKSANLLGIHQELTALSATLMDRLLAAQQHIHPQQAEPACRLGCDWCCHFLVTAPAPTIFAIARRLKDASPQVLSQISAGFSAAKPGDPPGLNMRCSLLSDHGCTVYEDRPFACRSKNALDASLCEQKFNDLSVDVPGYHLPSSAGARMTVAVSGALNDCGYDPSDAYIELKTGLSTVLNSESAEEDWLAGHRIFDGCHLDVGAKRIGSRLVPVLRS